MRENAVSMECLGGLGERFIAANAPFAGTSIAPGVADGHSGGREALQRVFSNVFVSNGPPLCRITVVVCDETPALRNQRRSYAGQASQESYGAALRRRQPRIELDTASYIAGH